jgi:H+/Cl- antiporter ClcA
MGVAVLGAVLGGLIGGFVVVGVTLVLKAGIDFASAQNAWYVVTVPVLGLAASVAVLHAYGLDARPPLDGPQEKPWRMFHPDVARADISADVVRTAGQEERFPWRLAPIRALAIIATVCSGAAMGTEAPAAYIGVATGAALGDRGRRWRRLLRPAAVAGGAAGVAALMAIPLVGTAFMLELGKRNRAPLSGERVAAALIGGLVGWGINASFDLKLIYLVVPKEAPSSLLQAVVAALCIGAASGIISSLAGLAVYRAKKWKAPPAVRLALGAAATVATLLALVMIASPSAAIGPGGGAIGWAESANALPLTLLAVCLLRAAATVAAVAAGAAGGFAGGYRLPFTAIAMVLGVGGPPRTSLDCVAAVGVAYFAGVAAEWAILKLKARRRMNL